MQFDKTVSAEGNPGSEINERRLEIRNKRGMHARASAKFVKCAEQFDAEIVVIKDGQAVAATSIMGLMTLAATPGSTIHIAASGPEAVPALDALGALVENGFGEDD
ncbi:MAG TPA: HPr family phosphocarrier protein [Afifellaceae bacterium]|nr:HPr family phosphocarrier protein [Afifellaceae bacterium]